jgi:hypothetical protein
VAREVAAELRAVLAVATPSAYHAHLAQLLHTAATAPALANANDPTAAAFLSAEIDGNSQSHAAAAAAVSVLVRGVRAPKRVSERVT